MIKRIINKIGKLSPDFIGRQIAKLPFSYRHSKRYSEFQNIINESKEWSENELENYIVTHFDKAFQHAKKFKIYKEKYKRSGVLNLVVKSVDDIKKVPILYKEEVRKASAEFNGYYPAQTGGTTGNPLHLYLDKNIWAREWAHYHNIWKETDYKYSNTRFLFREGNVEDDFLKYDFEHNCYHVNIYRINLLTNDNINKFFKILISKRIKYFQGYPSAINDFLKEIEGRISIEQKEILKENVISCFYNSEYPLSHMTDYIKNVWNLDFISCYGHTEACVLGATKKNQLTYFPFHTYGYIEIQDKKLIGTSYHNMSMPLIRYNTDDLALAERYNNGIVKSFEIKEGRNFYYILDKNNVRLSVVALIENLEVSVFDYVDYIQVFQEKQGFATLLLSKKYTDDIDLVSLLNLNNMDMVFDYVYLQKPIKTKAGKVPLRVHKLPNNVLVD